MTEADWLSCDRPEPLLRHVAGVGSRRRLVLCAIAACRSIERLFRTAAELAHLDAAEQYADGALDPDTFRVRCCGMEASAPDDPYERRQAMLAAGCLNHDDLAIVFELTGVADAYDVIGLPLPYGPETEQPWHAAFGRVLWGQAALIRDVFGNPFRPVAFDPAWRTEAAVGLAREMYAARDFAAMQVLADALEDAGCGDADVLAHCRGPGPHVRGCWVVDLVLGKG